MLSQFLIFRMSAFAFVISISSAREALGPLLRWVGFLNFCLQKFVAGPGLSFQPNHANLGVRP
jgi:hypothetical protein